MKKRNVVWVIEVNDYRARWLPLDLRLTRKSAIETMKSYGGYHRTPQDYRIRKYVAEEGKK